MSVRKKAGTALATVLGMFLGLVLLGLATGSGDTEASSATGDATCVPEDAWTETTDWVTESPGEGWRQVDERTVTDQEATTEQSDWVAEQPAGEGWVQIDTRTTQGEMISHGWQRYSWTGGQRGEDDPPPWPHADWNPNVEGDPHGIGVEGAYFRAQGQSGTGSWFYLEIVDPVYEEITEYLYEREVPAVTHQEFMFAYDHPAVECPPDPNGEDPNGEDPNGEDPNGEVPDQGTPASDEPAAQGPDEAADQQEPAGAADQPAGAEKAPIDRLPNAGPLSATTVAGWAGLLLLLAGVLTLAMVRRRRS